MESEHVYRDYSPESAALLERNLGDLSPTQVYYSLGHMLAEKAEAHSSPVAVANGLVIRQVYGMLLTEQKQFPELDRTIFLDELQYTQMCEAARAKGAPILGQKLPGVNDKGITINDEQAQTLYQLASVTGVTHDPTRRFFSYEDFLPVPNAPQEPAPHSRSRVAQSKGVAQSRPPQLKIRIDSTKSRIYTTQREAHDREERQARERKERQTST